MMDNGKRAFEYYQEITPTYIEQYSDCHKTEPYVYSQMIAGIEAPNYGEAKNSWLTGTASWSFVAASQYLLGVRPSLDGLYIEPKIDMEMNIIRKYLGHTIHIHIRRGGRRSFISNEELKKGEKDIYVEL